MIGKHLHDALPLEDVEGRKFWMCTEPYGGLSTRTRTPEVALQLPGGPELLVTAAFVRPGGPAGPVTRVVVCLREAVSRRRAERRSADLVSTVAHELRSPLTSVKGFTATLLAKWERFNDAQKRLMLETVNADADRVTRLISELLDVARIDSGRLEIHRQLVDLAAAVRRQVDGMVAAGESRGRFRLDLAEDLPETWADADKVAQVLANLLENAVRHGAGTVTVTVRPDPAGTAVAVSDEGPGIPPALAERVFTRFWRGDRRRGTGLGLYIVKGIVEAHGGSITLEPAGGPGARFRFVLPAGPPDFGF
jgi:signal transduction histidine kinase